MDRFSGAILGHAVGDALGVPVEFMSRDARKTDPVTGMREFGTHNQPAGTWSDDTSMMLCLLEGLTDGADAEGIRRLFKNWIQKSHWTPHGQVFDAGITTVNALLSGEGQSDEYSNGNGSLMRTIPIPLMMSEHPEEAVRTAHEISALTHAHPRSLIACGIFGEFVRRLFLDDEINLAWNLTRQWARKFYSKTFANEIHHFTDFLNRFVEDWRSLPESKISSGGYVIHTLEAAFWCFFTTENFSDCVLKAVNLGNDTDTTGAVAGGLAGCYYGEEAIPSEWLDCLARRADIEKLIMRAQSMVE